MATATGNYVCDNSSLANFKSWAQAISNAFSAFGWVQTADTGQVNWSTIAAVPSSTYVYEIWKANDTQAATMPIYVKVEYGFSSTQINIRMTVGTSSNGSGTITGTIVSSAPWQITNSFSNNGTTTYPCYFSGDSGEFRMWMWGVVNASPSLGCFFAIERSKDSTGAKSASYITVLSASQANNNLCFQQTLKAASAGLRDSGIVSPSITNGAGTGSSFGTVAAFPVFPILGLIGNPMLGVMTCANADVGINSTVTVASMYGSTHSYIAFGGNGNMSGQLGARTLNGLTVAGLMRYE